MTDYVYATEKHLWRVRTSQKKTDDGDCIRYILIGDKWLPHSQISDAESRVLYRSVEKCPEPLKAKHEHGLPFLT